MVDSECTPLAGSSSAPALREGAPVAPSPPYAHVGLIHAQVPHHYDDRWDSFEESRVAITTPRGVFVEQRGSEVSHSLPTGAVTIARVASENVVEGGEPELRITLQEFVGADEGVPEQYRLVELVCGTGASGQFSCARFWSRWRRGELPPSPVDARALRSIVFP